MSEMSGLPYYHFHEIAYQSLQKNGCIGWGDAKSHSELSDPATLNYLKNMIQKYFLEPQGKAALDIGCGSGPTAIVLRSMGFEVLGIDISPTAVEMAKALATDLNFEIDYQVHDILELGNLNRKFDLIYDSHCLHCIVFEEDRRKVFLGIRQSLSPNGKFIFDTMVTSEKMDLTRGNSSLRFDTDGVLWHQVDGPLASGSTFWGNRWWCAQRRIYSKEKLLNEVYGSGFEILESQLDKQSELEPAMLRLVLCKN